MDSVKSDMTTHTVTVQFDDETMSVDNVVKALSDAGYSVPAYKKSDG